MEGEGGSSLCVVGCSHTSVIKLINYFLGQPLGNEIASCRITQ